MKRKIRLTESDIHRIVKESVKKVLKERTKGERGLTDDEVSRMRTHRYAIEVDPYHEDSIYDDLNQEYMDRMTDHRLRHHSLTQNHKPNPLDMDDDELELYRFYNSYK